MFQTKYKCPECGHKFWMLEKPEACPNMECIWYMPLPVAYVPEEGKHWTVDTFNKVMRLVGEKEVEKFTSQLRVITSSNDGGDSQWYVWARVQDVNEETHNIVIIKEEE